MSWSLCGMSLLTSVFDLLHFVFATWRLPDIVLTVQVHLFNILPFTNFMSTEYQKGEVVTLAVFAMFTYRTVSALNKYTNSAVMFFCWQTCS